MLAQMLHKTVGEIEAMPIAEYYGWVEFLNEQDKPEGVELSGASADQLRSIFGG